MGPQKPSTPTPPPDDFGIGAPFAPPTTNPLGSPLLNVPDKKSATAAAQSRLRAVKAQRKADALKAKAQSDAIVAARQKAARQRAISGEVSAQAGLTPTSQPFGPQHHGAGAGAAPVESELTANSRLARARLQRLTHGGLLTPAQQQREAKAEDTASTSTAFTFADKPWHQLPYDPMTHRSLAAPSMEFTSLPPVKPDAPGTREPGSPRQQAVDAQPGQSQVDAGSLLGPAIRRGLGQVMIPGLNINADTVNMIGEQGQKASQALLPGTGSIAHEAVPLAWLKETLNPDAISKLTKNGKQQVFLDQLLTDEQRYGSFALGPTARKNLTARMVAMGWNAKDAPNLSDAELAARANTRFHDSLATRLRFAASDMAALTSMFSIPKQIGEAGIDSYRQGSLAPLENYAKAVGQGYANVLPVVGDRPWLENLRERPYSTITALLPFLKTAHGLSGRALGLRGVREVTLPSIARANREAPHGVEPQPETRVIPASKYPLYRAGQGVSDWFLKGGQTPAERPPGDGLFRHVPDARSVRGRVGNKIEERIVAADQAHARTQSTLESAQRPDDLTEYHPHVVLNRYARALRSNTGTWLLRRLKGEHREDAVRSIVFNGSIGKTSHEVEAFYRAGIEDSHGLAEKWRTEAATHERAARAAEAERTPEGNRLASRHDTESRLLLEDAKRMDGHAATQAEIADFVHAHPHDFRNPRKGEAAVLDAALKVAAEQDRLLVKSGRVDEKGVLFGRLQHHLAITHRMEGPGSELGGEHGTPAWREADLIMNREHGLRYLHNRARERLFDRQRGSEDGDPLPPSMDVLSPESKHQLGRYHRMSQLDRIAQGIGRRRQRRIENRLMSGHDDIIAATEDEMRRSGVDPALLGRMRSQATNAHGTLVHSGEERAVRAEQRAATERGREMGGHTGRIADELQVAYHDMKILKDSNRPINEIQRQQDKIDELHRQASEDYKPSEKNVLVDERLAEKTRLINGLRELSDEDIWKIIDRHLTPEQQARVGPQVHEALRAELDSAGHLDRTHAQIQQNLEEAGHKFTQASGQDPQLAVDYHNHSQHYRQRLRAYNQLLAEQGIRTGHIRLRHPDDPESAPQVRIATGEQFEHGNFGKDVHLELIGDLSSLQRQDVQGRVMAHLAEGPWVMTDVPDGAAPPPGFVAISKANHDNMLAGNPDREALTKMLSDWASKRPSEPIEGKQVFLSRKLQADIYDALTHDHSPGLPLRVTSAYRRWMLYIVPRTLINNAAGNPILARLVGGWHSKWYEAVKTLQDHPERLPSDLLGRGPRTAALDAGGMGLYGWRAMFRHHNAFHEDVGNVMVYLVDARAAFKDQNNLHLFNRISKWQEEYVQFLEDAAQGKNPDVHDWMAHSAQAFGNMHQHFKLDPTFSTSFLFHRWVGHVIYFTTISMPLHYPGRTAFLQQASLLAQDYERKNGAWPEWAIGMIPLFKTMEHLPAGMQQVVWAISQQGVNPLATPGQTFDQGNTAQPKAPFQAPLASNLSPFIRVPLEVAFGKRLDTLQDFKDQNGDPIGGLSWRVGANDVIANAPGLQTLFSRRGMSDNSIQVLPQLLHQAWPRYSNAAKYDSTLGSPSSLQYNWWQNLLFSGLSSIGMGVTPLDAEGVRSTRRAVAGEEYQNQQGAIRLSHQQQATVRMLKAMSLDQRKAWFQQHDPAGYARGDWRRLGP